MGLVGSNIFGREALALQLGAGLSVPMGTKRTIFVKGNADIRDGAAQ